MTLKITFPLLALLAGIASVTTNDPLFADDLTDTEQGLINQQTWPRNGQPSLGGRALWDGLRDVENIDEVEAALRKAFADQSKQSFSRDWWYWDRLRSRYVDEGRRDRVALHVLRAVFRGWILDWHTKLEAKGDGDLFYIFYTTTAGDKRTKVADDGRTLVRDVHGGGYHGGWGGAARMRIYAELVRNDMLSAEENRHFQQIVHQSLGKRFLNFEERSQSADNHAFGNAGGVALGIKRFPDAPQADAAHAWLDRIWADLAEFGYREWNYHPYGPIFLHGMLDVAEATGKLETDRELIESLGRRCLAFIHGGGVRGNPNAASDATFPVGTNRQAAIYADPWNTGYYRSEKSARDGHFWYRLAKQFEDPEFLWAAEQLTLGGRPPSGEAPAEYAAAYNQRFAWFVKRGIKPSVPQTRAAVGFLNPAKQNIPERLYLGPNRESGSPFASFFLYPTKDGHLDNVSGHLYEYAVEGTKLLHSSGKYNNVYDGQGQLRGSGEGEKALDLFLVMKSSHPFPNHPNRAGDADDYMRRGSIQHVDELLRAENNETSDSFGQFAFDHYYGEGSRWTRQAILTREGYLIVRDEYVGSPLVDSYNAGPCWLLRPDGVWSELPGGSGKQGRGVFNHAPVSHAANKNWFDAPAWDHAWWQNRQKRLLVWIHPIKDQKYGVLRHKTSGDISRVMQTDNSHAFAQIKAGIPRIFLSVLMPYDPDDTTANAVISTLETTCDDSGKCSAKIDDLTATIAADGSWSVTRSLE